LSRWGLRTMYVGNVGADDHGVLSLSLLREEGVDVSRARTIPGASSQFAVIHVQEDSGERTILWERDPRIRIQPEDIPRDEIRRSRAVLLDGHDVPACLESAREARGAGVPVVLDAEKVQEGTEDLLRLSDHIVAASSFVRQLLPGTEPAEGVREIHRRFSPRTAAVTLGADGALGFDGRETVRVRGIEVPAADTTGAGDVFHAGFLFGLLAGEPFSAILAFSNAAAALSCREVGGRAGIPSLDAIEQILSR
ncbi:MAG TPA: PfkB family carbohydrate kinase, partial [Candidatus Deferrimicrobiaceae bacterium]|nr:PfkB family carbohydrate kinase [Candidatus Deferrimicrobiaceae bacterium]